MTKNELYLKTLFCCMACDGDIATEEVTYVKDYCAEHKLFEEIDIDKTINDWVEAINREGARFLQKYLNELAEVELTNEEQLKIVQLAITMIEADNVIQYSEVKFFKKIRYRLTLSDEEILTVLHDRDDFAKEDYLLPDICVAEMPDWSDVHFASISL